VTLDGEGPLEGGIEWSRGEFEITSVLPQGLRNHALGDRDWKQQAVEIADLLELER